MCAIKLNGLARAKLKMLTVFDVRAKTLDGEQIHVSHEPLR